MKAGIYEALGARIKTERRRAGLTQSEFAPKIGLSRAALGTIETGRQQLLIHHLIRIAAELDVEVAQLLEPARRRLRRVRRIVGAKLNPAQRLRIERLVAELDAGIR